MARKKSRSGDEPDAAVDPSGEPVGEENRIVGESNLASPGSQASPTETPASLVPPADSSGSSGPAPESPSLVAPAPLQASLVNPPVATVAEPVLAAEALEQRIDRLEKAMAPIRQLEGLEERLLERMTSYFERPELVQTTPTPSPPPSAAITHSLLHRASTLGTVGKHLLQGLVPRASPTHAADPRSAPRPPARPWAIAEIVAELRSMFYMFVDPRYHLSLAGRVVPLVLLGLFLTTGWWAPYLLCGLGALLSKPIELLLCFGLIKILSYESRRYRETAPDLPPSLRL